MIQLYLYSIATPITISTIAISLTLDSARFAVYRQLFQVGRKSIFIGHFLAHFEGQRLHVDNRFVEIATNWLV